MTIFTEMYLVQSLPLTPIGWMLDQFRRTHLAKVMSNNDMNLKRILLFSKREPVMDSTAKKLSDEQLKIIEERYQSLLHAEPFLNNFDIEVRITRKNEKSAFPDKEMLLIGWEEIANFIGLHTVWCIERYGKKFHRDGIVFYKKARKASSGGRTRRYVCTYPSMLLAWCIRETQERRHQERHKIANILERYL